MQLLLASCSDSDITGHLVVLVGEVDVDAVLATSTTPVCSEV